MSDEPGESREWRFYVGDMLQFAEKALSYTEGLDQAAFVADTRTYDATLRNIELIGEAATHIPAEVQKAHPGVPWHAIVGARNRLAHGYLQISDSVIWSIVEDAIPALLPELRTILDTPTGRTESGE